PASSEAVTLILATIDRIKLILESLESEQREPDGADGDLITSLEGMVDRISVGGAKPENEHSVGTLVHQVLERPLREDEDTLDDTDSAFRNTAGDCETAHTI